MEANGSGKGDGDDRLEDERTSTVMRDSNSALPCLRCNNIHIRILLHLILEIRYVALKDSV